VSTGSQNLLGRPPVTDHASIERVAFELFATQGFEATTLETIAAAAGIGRRTLLRYYPSKNDIPWGQFEAGLVDFARTLQAMPHDIPVYAAVQEAVLAFNEVDEAALPQHRQRMRLLLLTPALQAHSALKYQSWRAVVASYVGQRFNTAADGLLPRTAGHVTLALALSAYEQWLEQEDRQLQEILGEALSGLRQYLADPKR
jgi:mycofactocin system transcriptional regulator